MHELAEFEERPQCLQSFDFVAAEDQLPQLPELADALECVFADSAWGGEVLVGGEVEDGELELGEVVHVLEVVVGQHQHFQALGLLQDLLDIS